jgi:hypothetical protein
MCAKLSRRLRRCPVADDITRTGSLRSGIRFEFSYQRGARWDGKHGWLDWSGAGEETTSAFPPSIRIAFTGNVEVLREAGCIDEHMWLTMQRSATGRRRGHCGRDARKQEWSRARRPTEDDPERIEVRRAAAAPDNNWPFYLPAVTELLRADVLREFRHKEAQKTESREQLDRILALTPDETRELVARLRADGWGNSDLTKRFLDSLEARALAAEQS